MDTDEGIFDFSPHGRCMFRPTISKWENNTRTDIITFDDDRDMKELEKNLNIGNSASKETIQQITNIVKRHWDAFCSEGCRRPIIGYEFAIDTGTSTPVCKYNGQHSCQSSGQMTHG